MGGSDERHGDQSVEGEWEVQFDYPGGWASLHGPDTYDGCVRSAISWRDTAIEATIVDQIPDVHIGRFRLRRKEDGYIIPAFVVT